MRTKARQTAKRKIDITYIIGTIIALYITGSFIEVNVHNRLDSEPLENPYNAFMLLSQAMNEE